MNLTKTETGTASAALLAGGTALVVCALLALFALTEPPVQAQGPNAAILYPTYGSARISTNATTSPMAAPGVLHTICINTKGASSNTATVYDNASSASSPVLATIDTTTAVGCLLYDAAMTKGITIVTATGTAPDMTVTYRLLR